MDLSTGASHETPQRKRSTHPAKQAKCDATNASLRFFGLLLRGRRIPRTRHAACIGNVDAKRRASRPLDLSTMARSETRSKKESRTEHGTRSVSRPSPACLQTGRQPQREGSLCTRSNCCVQAFVEAQPTPACLRDTSQQRSPLRSSARMVMSDASKQAGGSGCRWNQLQPSCCFSSSRVRVRRPRKRQSDSGSDCNRAKDGLQKKTSRVALLVFLNAQHSASWHTVYSTSTAGSKRGIQALSRNTFMPWEARHSVACLSVRPAACSGCAIATESLHL